MPPSEFPPEATAERPRKQSERKPLDWPALSGREPPARHWAIKGWLGFGHTTLLVGAGGIGKTLIAQQAASCLALGRNFIGEVTEPCKVLMWACEDDHDELWRRQIAISHWTKNRLAEYAENLVIVPRHGMDNALAASEFGRITYTPALGLLEEQARDEHAKVVILDNAAQLYGGSENDRHSVTAFLNALAGALHGMAVLLLAHPSRGLNSEFSGSSAWDAVARTRLYLGTNLPDQKQDMTDDPSPQDVRYLSRRKANYSNKDWRRCIYRDGVLIPDEDEASDGILGTIKAGNAERVIIEGMKKLTEMGLTGSDGATSPRFLPRVLGEYKLSAGLNRNELADAMRRLMMDGTIVRGEVGKTSNRNPVYGLMLKDQAAGP